MTAVTKAAESALPAHLQGGKKSSFGKIDSNDLIIPRVKLLQATSEEVQTFAERGAKIGQFWHTIAEEAMGDKLRFIPLVLQKELVLWAPRGDDRGILARSKDLVHWDAGFENLKFEVKIKGVKDPVTYNTKGSVAESGLAEFGSLIPGDMSSRPAASLTYRMMFFFPDFASMSPAVVINTRSSIKPAKGLITKIEMREVDHYGQMYVMGTTDEKGDEGPYKGYSYTAAGFADAEQYAKAKEMFERFEGLDWKANEESDETPVDGAGKAAGPSDSNKF